MTDFNTMVWKYTIRESDKIIKICEPLHLQLGVKHFWYSRTSAEGGYFSLASHPEMHDYYHSSKLHLHSPFFHNPKYIQPGFYFYNTIKNQKFQETFDVCSNKHKMKFGGNFVIKEGQSMLRFGYAFDTSIIEASSNIIINNINLLLKFNDYFIKEIQTILNRAQDDLVSLPAELGAAYEQIPQGLGSTLGISEKCKFLEKIGLIKEEDANKLTLRERECLKYILEGLSARLIADALHLSTRTVEKHLESIKNKLNCFSKADLYYHAHLFQIAGLFD